MRTLILPSPRRFCALLLAVQVAGAGACTRPPETGTARDAARLNLPATEAMPMQEVDVVCLRRLDNLRIVYRLLPVEGGMRTPVEVGGPIAGVALVPRGRRAAVMDCVLASALADGAQVFHELGITALTFSAAFDHRTRRGSSQASAHAYGLAIDVHTIRGKFGEYDVRQQFERGVGLWRRLRKDPALLDECVGRPATEEGRVLRRLACRLKLHAAFRVIVTPDDDADHQDHLHLEAGATFFPPATTF